MSNMSISEYSVLPTISGGTMQVAPEPSLVDQDDVAIGASSTQSAAFSNATQYISVQVDVACRIRIGSNPTAVVTKKRLPAEAFVYFKVNPGDKIAVIASS
jgi:LysM repeat protein